MAYTVRRRLHDRVLEALADMPVVVLIGARAVGKSTMTRAIAEHDHPAQLVDLDDKTLRDAAANDPTGFIAGYGGPLLIDEIQRAPDLLPAIKESVFKDQRPGRFLLTGSANILTAPRIREALVGRAEFITLWPFSQAELDSRPENFVEQLLAGEPPTIAGAPIGRAAFAEVVAKGGYPDVHTRTAPRRRRWYESYLTSIIERDLRDLADIHKLGEVPRLLRVLASQAAGLFAPGSVATGGLGLDRKTIERYTALLETVFIVKRIPAWAPGIGSREIQHAKVYVVDSGLLAYLMGADETRIAHDDQITGKILENFVAMEIARLVDCADVAATQYHYRRRGDEIDVVIETNAGDVAAVEVKASATVVERDYRAIAAMRDTKGGRFVAGVVLYTGAETKPLGDRVWAVPISGLWD